MPDPEAILEVAKDWLEDAELDLSAARLYEEHAEELSPRIAAFHAQQASEKALKALLVLEQIPVPKKHDLEMLRALVKRDVGLPDGSELAFLSQYAVWTRYPDHPPTAAPLAADVELAIEMAQRVIDGVREELRNFELSDD